MAGRGAGGSGVLYINRPIARNERAPALNTRVYLDHAATTPMLPAAREAWAAGVAEWANPSSPHAEGRRARALLEEARRRIAAALGWTGHVLLTSGATEAIALAVLQAKVGRVLVSPLEHDAVHRALKLLPGTGRAPPTTPFGRGPPPRSGEELICRQTVNSETGLILTPPDRAAGELWLADCAQSAGKLPIPDADFAIVSAHKLGGPPGVGAMLVRDLATLRAVGGQEKGYRGGTENLPGALAFAAALEAPRDWLVRAERLRARLDAGVLAAGGEIVGGDAPRLATIAAYGLPGVTAAAQLVRLDLAGIAVSAGSACSSGSLRTSPVLRALRLSETAAGEVIRVSLGWTSTETDIDRFLAAWTAIAAGRSRAAA